MDAQSLRKMTVAELREEARKLGDVKGISSMKKDDLVRLLAGGGDAAADGPSGASRLASLKRKVREIKAKRAYATEHGQRAKVSEFNQELHRYRHWLRRAARRRRRSSPSRAAS